VYDDGQDGLPVVEPGGLLYESIARIPHSLLWG